MNIKKILVPIDFSTQSATALGFAESLAADRGATLLITHVREQPDIYAETGFGGYPLPQDEAETRRALSDMRPINSEVSYCHQLLTGYPADELAEYARRESVDLIVMGTHGRTGLSRLLMGSVAEAVVRHSPCPVLTIKQPDTELSTWAADEANGIMTKQKGGIDESAPA